MKLSQKIKHIKRHKKNKKLKDRAEYIYWLVLENSSAGNETTYDGKVYVVSTLLYEIMRMSYGYVPDCIKRSSLVGDNFLVVLHEIIEFFDNELDYLKDWCGIPKGADIPFVPGSERELYMHIDKPIAPDICTLNGVRV